MKYNLSTKNVDLAEADHVLLTKKINILEKHLQPPYQIDVRFTRSTAHHSGPVITQRINVGHGQTVFHSERSGDTIQDALDDTLAAITRELSKEHDKKKDAHE